MAEQGRIRLRPLAWRGIAAGALLAGLSCCKMDAPPRAADDAPVVTAADTPSPLGSYLAARHAQESHDYASAARLMEQCARRRSEQFRSGAPHLRAARFRGARRRGGAAGAPARRSRRQYRARRASCCWSRRSRPAISTAAAKRAADPAARRGAALRRAASPRLDRGGARTIPRRRCRRSGRWAICAGSSRCAICISASSPTMTTASTTPQQAYAQAHCRARPSRPSASSRSSAISSSGTAAARRRSSSTSASRRQDSETGAARAGLARIAAGTLPPPLVATPQEGAAEALFDLASLLNQRDTIDAALDLCRGSRSSSTPNFALAQLLAAEIRDSQGRTERRARALSCGRSEIAARVVGAACARRSRSMRSTAPTRRSPRLQAMAAERPDPRRAADRARRRAARPRAASTRRRTPMIRRSRACPRPMTMHGGSLRPRRRARARRASGRAPRPISSTRSSSSRISRWCSTIWAIPGSTRARTSPRR